MARGIHRLSALQVRQYKKPGYYPDGGGLYLQVTKSVAKSWLFRFMLNGRAREMGLGPLHTVSLEEARIKAADCRKQLLAGIDPIEARKSARDATKLAATKSITFQKCADAYVEAHRAGWKSAKHAEQWENTLATYAFPIFGSLPVASVDTALVMKCLEAIWASKAETASRLRGRIESVLDWAAVRGYRHGENPARWKGHLDKLLPARSKIAKVEHHPALPYTEIGAFMKALRKQEGIAPKALGFTILTAARTGEVIGARWSEIDFAKKVWTIPEDRMKAEREHRVPLCDTALAILKEMEQLRDGEFVFPGRRVGSPLSNMAMLQLLERMDAARQDDDGKGWRDPDGRVITVHGFRSAFRDWAAEMTNYSREVAEMALSHVVGDKVEAAYRRGDLFEKRRRIMEDWATYCDRAPRQLAKVTPIGEAKIRRKKTA